MGNEVSGEAAQVGSPDTGHDRETLNGTFNPAEKGGDGYEVGCASSRRDGSYVQEPGVAKVEHDKSETCSFVSGENDGGSTASESKSTSLFSSPGSKQQLADLESNDSLDHVPHLPLHEELSLNPVLDASPKENAPWVDPILAAAAAGAAAQQSRSKTQRSLKKFPLRVSVDDDWRSSWQRFTKTATSTVATVATAAAPIVHEAAAALKETTAEARLSARDAVKSYKTAMGETGEYDAQQREDDDIDQEEIGAGDGPPLSREEASSAKYGGSDFRPMLPENGEETEEAITPKKATKKIASWNEMETPLRKHTARQLTIPPNVFEGTFSSNHVPRPPYFSDGDGATKSLVSQTSGTVSSYIDDHEQPPHLVEMSQQLLDAVSKKLALEYSPKPRDSRNHRSSRGVKQSGSITLRPSFDSLLQSPQPSFEVEDSVFASQRKHDDGENSLSSPGSPILSSARSSITAQSTPVLSMPQQPVVDLWNMIPEKKLQVTSVREEGKVTSDQTEQDAKDDTLFSTAAVMSPTPSKWENSSSSDGSSDFARLANIQKNKHEQCETASLGSNENLGRKRPWRSRRMSRRSRRSSAIDVRSMDDSDQSSMPLQRDSIIVDTHLIGAADDRSMRSSYRVYPDSVKYVQEAEVETRYSEDMLEKELLAFSSLDEIDFLEGIRHDMLPEPLKRLASLRWRQLTANWRHSEMMKALITRPCSLHFYEKNTRATPETDDWSNWSSATTFGGIRGDAQSTRDLVFPNKKLPSVANNLSGFTPLLGSGDFPTLTSFVAHLGPLDMPNVPLKCQGLSTENRSSVSALRHKLEAASEIKASSLVNTGKRWYPQFSELIEKLAGYASFAPQTTRTESPVTFSTDIKTVSAIRGKAECKYRGDVLQVKDVLRGQIVLPNESYLVCSLAYLNKLCVDSKKGSGLNSSEAEKKEMMQIVRIKNLFADVRESDMLPTGYRHLLVNIRLGDGFLAEIQFQIAQMFNVLGSSGYELHKHLVSLESACGNDTWDNGDKTVVLGDIDQYVLRRSLSVPVPGKSRNISEKVHPPIPDVKESSKELYVKQVLTDQSKGGNTVPGAGFSSQPPLASPFVGGGIAVAVDEGKTEPEPESNPPLASPFAGGGIAGAAALAASKRNQSKDDNMDSRDEEGKTEPELESNPPLASPFAGGGIAGAAALAASKRNQSKDDNMDSRDEEGKTEPELESKLPGDAAALAVSKRNEGNVDKTKGIENKDGKPETSENERKDLSETEKTEPDVVAPLGVVPAYGGPAFGMIVPEGQCLWSNLPMYSSADVLSALLKVALADTSCNSSHVSTLCCLQTLCTYALTFMRESEHSDESNEPELSFEPKTSMARVPAAVPVAPSLQNETGRGIDASVVDEKKQEDDTLVPLTSKEKKEQTHCMYHAPLRADFLLQTIERSLLRSLAIANQAVSIGMTGWLEYGSSNFLDRTVGRPLDILAKLACHHARQKSWTCAKDVLRALVLQCEQHLPLYHPITLASLLDLAGAMAMSSEFGSAKRIVARVTERLAYYLSEQEDAFLSFRDKLGARSGNDGIVLSECTGSDHVVMLKNFVSLFRALNKRDFSLIFPKDHELSLLNQTLLGDSLTVLANCMSLSEEGKYNDSSFGTTSARYWREARGEYRKAFEGWMKKGYTLCDPNVAALACSMARCLRELGQSDGAISILTAAVAAQRSRPVEHRETTQKEDKAGTEIDDAARAWPASVAFLPPTNQSNSSRLHAGVSIGIEQLIALNLWSMAAYTVESSPDERGRIRALSLLHASSEALQRAFKGEDEPFNSHRILCLEMLQAVENEASELFEPIQVLRDRRDRGQDDPTRGQVTSPLGAESAGGG